MHKRQLTVVGIVVVATILFAITTFRQQAQDKIQSQQDKVEQDEPTVVKKGQVTDKEREYSKEYKKLYSYRQGKKLSEVSELSKSRGNTKEVGVMIGIPTVPTFGNMRVLTASEFLKDLSCQADAIVIGSTKSKTAHLTDGETFVYTEYEFSVHDTLKNNSASPIEVNNNIQITRPGGLIKLDNQVIRAEDLSYAPLQKNKEYLLFLRFIPSAKGYVVSNVKGDFILENYSFKKLSRFALPEEMESYNDSQTLLNNVRNSVSVGCNQNSKGGD